MSSNEEKVERLYGGNHGAHRHKWIEKAKAEAQVQHGMKNDREATEYAERDWQKHGKPFVDGHPKASIEQTLAFRAGINRPRQSDDVIAERSKQLLEMRSRVAEPRAAFEARAKALDAEQRADSVLGPAIRDTGLAGDPWFAHLALAEEQEQGGK